VLWKSNNIKSAIILAIFSVFVLLSRWKKLHNALAEDFDPLQMDISAMTELVGKFLAKHKEYEQSVEQRVEHLERQVTETSFDLIRTKGKCYAYEVGMKELLEVDSINAIKDRVYQLQVIAGVCIGHLFTKVLVTAKSHFSKGFDAFEQS